VAIEQPHTLMQFIRKVSDPYRVREVPDGQLLRQFVERREEAAFAALVKRQPFG
jgi:hypothetical protein